MALITISDAVTNLSHIKESLGRAELSEKDLGENTGLGEDAILAYESGKILPPEYAYNRIAAVLDWLPIGGVDEAFHGHAVHPARLIVGNVYSIERIGYRNSRESGTNILLGTFSFIGNSDGKYCFRHTAGGWTVSLSRSQLVDRIIQEVKT